MTKTIKITKNKYLEFQVEFKERFEWFSFYLESRSYDHAGMYFGFQFLKWFYFGITFYDWRHLDEQD